MTQLPALVLFDLDGTLVDPAGAITNGIAGALEAAGLPVPPEDRLGTLVGPPLGDSLRAAGVPEERLGEVIALYRAGYRAQGMAASRVYPGIPELLGRLLAAGLTLAVATQKPTGLARELLRLKGLNTFFEGVHGAEGDDPAPDDPGLGKVPILQAALAAADDFGPVLMVGDRLYDMAAARHLGIPGIGVSWGFAADGELEAAGASAVVHSMQELEAVIKRLAVAQPETASAGGPVPAA
ncbi:HAD hydrolase-like protein [Arthrobacter sp. NPDC055138]